MAELMAQMSSGVNYDLLGSRPEPNSDTKTR